MVERIHKGSSDPFDPSFWFITDSMGYPEGTQAGGQGVPFEDAELVLIKHFYGKGKDKFSDFKRQLPGRQVVGGAMIGWGSAMLVPGPVDAIAYGLGVAAFKHPFGGVAGVAAYNIFALGVIGTGAILSFS